GLVELLVEAHKLFASRQARSDEVEGIAPGRVTRRREADAKSIDDRALRSSLPRPPHQVCEEIRADDIKRALRAHSIVHLFRQLVAIASSSLHVVAGGQTAVDPETVVAGQ